MTCKFVKLYLQCKNVCMERCRDIYTQLFIEGRLEVKLPTYGQAAVVLWRIRRESIRDERVSRKKIRVREQVKVAKHSAFSNVSGRKVDSLKRRVRSHLVENCMLLTPSGCTCPQLSSSIYQCIWSIAAFFLINASVKLPSLSACFRRDKLEKVGLEYRGGYWISQYIQPT